MTARYIEILLETEQDEAVVNAAIQEYRRERCNLLVPANDDSEEE